MLLAGSGLKESIPDMIEKLSEEKQSYFIWSDSKIIEEHSKYIFDTWYEET